MEGGIIKWCLRGGKVGFWIEQRSASNRGRPPWAAFILIQPTAAAAKGDSVYNRPYCILLSRLLFLPLGLLLKFRRSGRRYYRELPFSLHFPRIREESIFSVVYLFPLKMPPNKNSNKIVLAASVALAIFVFCLFGILLVLLLRNRGDATASSHTGAINSTTHSTTTTKGTAENTQEITSSGDKLINPSSSSPITDVQSSSPLGVSEFHFSPSTAAPIDVRFFN